MPACFAGAASFAARALLACTCAAHAVANGATPPTPPGGKATPGAPYAAMAPFECADASLACASAATPAWAPDGSLWVAWVAGGAVSVARSRDAGLSFFPAVVIGRHGAYNDVGPDARPQIAVRADGGIVVVYGVFKDDAWNARVLASTSRDGGATFSAPRAVTDDPASQRFPAIAPTGDGRLFVAWIDKRLAAEATRRGKRRPGASLAYAWSDDGGETFSAARIAHAHSCECCRIGVDLAPGQRPVALFRAIFDRNVRDHAVLRFDDRGSHGPAHRVADDHWAIDACPHHGPALAVAADGTYHAAWFTQGRARSGAYFASSRDAGKTFSTPMRIGGATSRASRPHLLATGSRIWLAWKEFDGERTTVRVQVSDDSGVAWSPARPVARTDGYSDHPLLTAHRGDVYLSWQTRREGYRLLKLETQPMRQP